MSDDIAFIVPGSLDQLTGGYLFAMLQRSNAIVPLRIDRRTGKLSRSGEDIPLPTPVCAKFVEIS